MYDVVRAPDSWGKIAGVCVSDQGYIVGSVFGFLREIGVFWKILNVLRLCVKCF